MIKLLKFALYILLILFILSPFFIGSKGIEPKKSKEALEIEGGSFFEIDNYTSYYIDYGVENEKTILLLHGFGGSAINWLPAMELLQEEGFRVIALDLKGFGFSEKDKSGNYSHRSQAEFVNSFLEKLEIEEVVLVGHSMGGNIATMFSQSHPEKVSKLVLVSAAISHERQSDWFRENALGILDYPILKEYVRIVLNLSLTSSRVENIFESATYQFEEEYFEKYFVDVTQFKNWEYVLIKMLANNRENVLDKGVENMEIPTLMIWGEEDTWVPLSEGEYLERLIEDSNLEILEEVGHLPMLEDSEGFVEILLKNI